MSRPLVSVLLTSYNRADMLAEAIASVRAQTMKDFELIVLDDNSPASSGVARVLARIRDPRMWILQSRIAEKERPAKARYAVMINKGLRLASGRFVSYLCDDDLYLPRRLEVLSAALAVHQDIRVVYGPQIVRQAGRPDMIRFDGGVLEDPAYLVDHCSVMHRADLGLHVGGWDESAEGQLVGDAKFWRRLCAAGCRFHPVPGEPLDVHRHHPGTMTGLLSDEQIEADRLAGRLR